MNGSEHEGVHRIRVRYCETDRMGLAHHGSYVAWFEEARTEWMRERGFSYREMEDGGLLLQVVDMSIQYKRPVTYDEVIVVRTRVIERKRVSIKLEYRVEVGGDDGQLATLGTTTLAGVRRDGGLTRLPADL